MSNSPSSTSEAESPPYEPWRYLLQTYLRMALSPAFVSGGVALTDLQRQFPWPENPELVKSEGARRLRKVEELDIWEFRSMVRNYLDDAADAWITELDKPLMQLPCQGLDSVLTQRHADYLNQIDDQDKFLIVLMKFLLTTVSHSCRIFNNIPYNAPLAKLLMFEATRSPDEANPNNWDILRISETMHGAGPLTLICVPPWLLDLEDLKAFARPGRVGNEINTLHAPWGMNDSSAVANTLWAVVHDECNKKRGTCFVVTNYHLWCFGRFTDGWMTVTVSRPIELDMIAPNGARVGKKTKAVGLGCTVAECLVFWVQMARGVAPWTSRSRAGSPESESV